MTKEGLSTILDYDKVVSLYETMATDFGKEPEALLIKNGGTIELRRTLNDYLTFSVVDKNNEIVILKKSISSDYTIQCGCKVFEHQNICKHSAAVLLSVIRQIDAEGTEKEEPMVESTDSDDFGELKSYFTVTDAKDFGYRRLHTLFPDISKIAPNKRLVKKELKNGIEIEYMDRNAVLITTFIVNSFNDVEIGCSCGKVNQNKVCLHALMGLRHFADSFYGNVFSKFLNRDIEKNKILEQYGLSLDDPEAKAFVFTTDYSDRLVLQKAPEFYVGVHQISKFKEKFSASALDVVIQQRTFLPDDDDFKVGIVFMLTHDDEVNNPLKIEAYKNEKGKKGVDKITRLLLSNEDNIKVFSVLEDELFDALMDFSFLRYRNVVHFDNNYSLNFSNFQKYYTLKSKESYMRYFISKLNDHWHILSQWGEIKFLKEGENFHQSHLFDLTLDEQKVDITLAVEETKKFIVVTTKFSQNGEFIDTSLIDIDIYSGLLVKLGNHLYMHNNPDMLPVLETMPKGKLFFPLNQKSHVMKEILLPLHLKFDVILPVELELEVKEQEMVPAVHFREFDNKFLMLEPKFYYGEKIISKDQTEEIFDKDGDKSIYIPRSYEAEESFVNYVKSIHPSFKNQHYTPYFQLPFDDVMKNQWFIHASKQMMDQGIKLIGVKELTRFKYNTSTPKWNMSITSGIDWFDVEVSANWGDEVVGFKDIKKAIMNGQSFVVLGDGSFGVIPEEWIKKYSFLFKISKESKDGIQVSKKHFGIVDLLFDQIDDEQVRAEIQEKKQKLLNIGDVKTIDIPKEITATLRPYQESGYQWMQVLDEVSWGGCLADDMGLGKTLQAITFLMYVKNKYKNPTSLIICPTSLIFNWESELKKFAPTLKYFLYYGLGRTFTKEDFSNYDIIVTSYGNARNDIETLMQYKWEYIILDESQAIKNPDASTTKAMQLLKSRNKLILSGTPLQNNTFDIYAQFNFLNPGLLGSKEFFKNEFSQPIDKYNNKEASVTLRNMIKPFMLRRTKSEVAADLPEKTESILWCEMDGAQKEMYDEFKNYYRQELTQKIEADGMAKSGMYILEGLLRLRQICDDPRLIKDAERKPTKGAKIIELMREINENTGEHKMLIFSQFTEMLALIRAELDAAKIKYCYLDGSTPALKRNEEVEIFQNNPEIKVFLISLKAGGVGLNLTEADYVYIVDPWWNPAVEQQAIDRTHRIGQKNNIFAYKMICKGSVEEKILLLQEKKLGISKEIISEDSAFFKKLTKEDIHFLFS